MRTLAAVLFLAAACSSDDGPPAERPWMFGGARPTALQVPPDFDPSKEYPLLVILHGYGVTSSIQQGYFQLADVAATHDMLVLAPDGTPDSGGMQFWNADPACCDLDGTGVDDVAYLGGLIDDVREAWPVDPARVAVIGHSNGSFMAYRLACERADVVTAIAGLAGHGTSIPCAPARPVHVLHIHGTADATVPYESGTFLGVQSPGAVDSIAQWAAHNGCAGGPADNDTLDLEQRLAGDETTITLTTRCPSAGAADLWTMTGAGHIPTLTNAFPTELLGWLAAHHRP